MANAYCAVSLFVSLALGLCRGANTEGFMSELHDLNKADNMVISPFVLSEGLAQLYLGTRGETASEIASVISDLNSFKGDDLNSYLTMKREEIGSTDVLTFNLTNRIFVAENIPILKSFEVSLLEGFKSKIKKIDFSSPKNVELINKWVSKQTDKNGTKIVDNINTDVAVVLLNVIYFKGKWQHPFDTSFTEKAPFYLLKEDEQTEIVDIPMMNRIDLFRHSFITKLDATVIELPYASPEISMLIVLPREIKGIYTLIDSLKDFNINELLRDSRKSRLQLSMPKFKIEYQLEVSELLRSMGIKALFDNGDFSGMTSYKGPLCLCEVIQRGSIEIDEEGAKGSSVIVPAMFAYNEAPMKLAPMEQIEINHPFVFYIKDNKRILFAGKVMTPLLK